MRGGDAANLLAAIAEARSQTLQDLTLDQRRTLQAFREIDLPAVCTGLTERQPRVEDVMRAVAIVADLSIEEIRGQRRDQRASVPRRIAMLLTAELRPELSLPQIAVWFQKDHTTVIHAKRKALEMLGVNDERHEVIYRQAKQVLGVD